MERPKTLMKVKNGFLKSNLIASLSYLGSIGGILFIHFEVILLDSFLPP
jgi:hypothetical protein